MRQRRKLKKGAKYHVCARINRQEMLFFNNFYKKLLLYYIERAKKKFTFKVFSISIMGNHFHMIIQPTGDSCLSDIMKSILGGFAVKFNKMNHLKGHVWYDRLKVK